MSADERLHLLATLRQLTERQIDAARRLDGEAMAAINAARSETLFDLQVALQEPPPEEPALRSALAELASDVVRLERRLTHIVATTLNALGQLAPASRPTSTPTYRPSGLLAV